MQMLDRDEFEHIIAVITQENVKIWEQLYKKKQADRRTVGI